jgi:Putative metallopeptidase
VSLGGIVFGEGLRLTRSDHDIARRIVLGGTMIVALVLVVAGCGGGSSSSGSTASGNTSTARETKAAAETGGEGEAEGAAEAEGTEAGSTRTGQVVVKWQKPHGEANVVGYEMLKASETQYLAESLASAFELPNTLTVKGVNGFGGGPFFNPEDNSITLPYEFATVVLGVIARSSPKQSRHELGESVGAVNSFIFAHEFGHALIHNFELPVLGREEDAADGLATVVLLLAEEGSTYAAEAAEFWLNFSGRQTPPKLAEYADNHSFDRQRADNILCWIGGSNEAILQAFVESEVLPESRAVSCPAEWELLKTSAEQVLDPHLKNGVNLEPEQG